MSYYGNDPGSGGGFYNPNMTTSSTGGGDGYAAAANVQAWQQASTQQQQHSYDTSQQQQQQQQTQQQQQPASVWNPAAAATMAAVASQGLSNDAVFKSISTYGESFFKEGTARMIPGLESTMLLLRNYFAVDNKYVRTKIQKVLFPFTSRYWQRQIKQHAGPDMPTQYELPITDENAPDLYLPSMSLITYVLLCALCYGTAGQFNPEVISNVTFKCFGTQILEVLAIRLGFYLMHAPVALLDLFSYTGYKYLGLVINLMVGLLVSHFGLGVRGYYVCFCWTASACAYFMLKLMANNVPMETAHQGPKREVMVLAFAVSQLATMWFLSQTKFL